MIVRVRALQWGAIDSGLAVRRIVNPERDVSIRRGRDLAGEHDTIIPAKRWILHTQRRETRKIFCFSVSKGPGSILILAYRSELTKKDPKKTDTEQKIYIQPASDSKH